MERPLNAGFGTLLLVVFCPPLYFATRGRAALAVLHGCLYLLALLTLIFGIGIFFWLVGFVHAYWDFAHVKQEQVIQRHATVIAEKMIASANATKE